MIQIFNKISAILNTGKLDIDIKSLTHHKNSLSIRFPIVHEIKKLNIIRDIYLILNKYIKTKSAIILIDITINIFKFIHRDIHRLNTGFMKSTLDRIDLL